MWGGLSGKVASRMLPGVSIRNNSPTNQYFYACPPKLGFILNSIIKSATWKGYAQNVETIEKWFDFGSYCAIRR